MNKQVTLVTGATSGMGKETAFLLAKNGHRVYAGARTAESGKALVEEGAAKGLTVNAVVLDVTEDSSVRSAVSLILKETGRIDNLVNNAGFGLLATVEEATDEEIFRQFDVNVFGVGRTCRAVLPIMRQQHSGVIINISSWLGKMGFPLLAYYNASKYAVEAVTDSLRYEVAPFGIRAHTVMPGLFGTQFVKKGLIANKSTTSSDSPYASLVEKLVPLVAKKINEGPDPIAVAEAVLSVINNPAAPIRTPVGVEATTFVPMVRDLSDEAFEQKVKEIFGL